MKGCIRNGAHGDSHVTCSERYKLRLNRNAEQELRCLESGTVGLLPCASPKRVKVTCSVDSKRVNENRPL